MRAFGNVHDALVKHGVNVPVVLHSWTGSEEMVTTFSQLPRVYFSLSGHLAKVPPQKAINMVRPSQLQSTEFGGSITHENLRCEV